MILKSLRLCLYLILQGEICKCKCKEQNDSDQEIYLQGLHAPWLSLKVLEFEIKNSRPWKSLKIAVAAGKSLNFSANFI